MASRQLRYLHAWHIPMEMMNNYRRNHRDDPDVFMDFTAHYRRNELEYAMPAYGGLLSGPTWQRFVRWWHTTQRTKTHKSIEEQESLKYTLATYLDDEGWNYVNGISKGCTTFVGPDDVDEYKEINYLILQACNYYEKVYSEHWVGPLLTALRNNERIPVTTSFGDTFIPPADSACMSNYDCIDYMMGFGTLKQSFMEDVWKLSSDTAKTTKSYVSLKGTIEAIRGTVSGAKRSEL